MKSLDLVLDIETIADYRSSEEARAVAEMAQASGRELTPEAFAALSPALASVVCVGFRNLTASTERAFLNAGAFAEGARMPLAATPCTSEADLLAGVNRVLSYATRLITFRGRAFDIPVLVHRMAASQVKPCDFLLSCFRQPRFKLGPHVDLYEQFTAQGAVSGGCSLRAFALGYGFPDPKADGCGADVAKLVEAGDAVALADYCLGDVRTAAHLYERWRELCGVV